MLENLFQTDKETIIAYFSIPLISMGFTYMHIWAALFMTFYPIGFIGCFQIPGTNVGFPLGWQGIIPFKVSEQRSDEPERNPNPNSTAVSYSSLHSSLS